MKTKIVIFILIYVFLQISYLSVRAEESKDLFSTGINYYYSNNLDKALEIFEAILKNDPSNDQALFYKAQILSYKGETARAAAVLNKAIELKPDRLFYLYKEAEFYSILKDWDNSIVFWKKINVLTPEATEPYYALADIYQSMGKIPEAISQMELALLVEAQVSPQTYLRLGKLYLKISQEDKAFYYLDKAVDLESDSLEDFLYLGDLFYEKGNPGKALAYYTRVMALDPSKVYIQRRLAYLYYLKGDLDKSLFYFEKLTRMEPAKGENYYNLGCIYYMKEDFINASKNFSLAIEKEKNKSIYHYNLGCSMFKEGNYDEALNEFLKSTGLDQKAPDYLYALGAIYYLRKEKDKSFENLSLIKSESPSSKGYLLQCITYRDKGRVDIPIKKLEIPEKDLTFSRN